MKTQVEFDLGYNPLIFYGVMGLFKVIAHLAGASVSYGHISSHLNDFSSATTHWILSKLQKELIPG